MLLMIVAYCRIHENVCSAACVFRLSNTINTILLIIMAGSRIRQTTILTSIVIRVHCFATEITNVILEMHLVDTDGYFL